MVHIGCHDLYCILLNLTNDIVLSMDWLYAINPQIDLYAFSLSLDCGGHIVCILSI